MELSRLIAQKIVAQKLKESKESNSYKDMAYEYLNHHLGTYETHVTVEDVDVLSETPSTVTLRVEYSVGVSIPMYDPEDERTYNEVDTEYRTQTLTLEL